MPEPTALHRLEATGLARLAAKACLAMLAAIALLPDAPAAQSSTTTVGEAIFQRGVLGSGQPLEAVNAAGVHVRGEAAACVNCHRRSGLGSREGRSLIPPITGRYLFRPLVPVGDDAELPYVEGVRDRRAPYTPASLARAVRDGIDSEGRQLKALMPHFRIDDGDMAALTSYLVSLDQRHVPGVTDTVLHFATIITPDADPVQRSGMLAVLKQFVAERNARQMSPAPRMHSGRVVSFMVHRQWQLHVWELTGPEDTWGEQLERRMAAQPVFAVLSGLAGRSWAPVHRFCEHARVPCLFPNVDVPVDAERDFYSVYFSKGVLLEAELVATRMLAADGALPRRVHQILRAGDSGEAGADALAALLAARGVKVESHILAQGATTDRVAAEVRAAAGADALVLWLRPPDLAALGDPPPATTDVFMSGLLGQLEGAPLPAAWRARTSMSYPLDLPDRRRVRVDFAFGWFRIRHIPVVAERVQLDTYLACGLVSEVLNQVSDTFVREYLVERTEDMLSHRIMTALYPRLSLAQGQRFASKGGYIVRFSGPDGRQLVTETDWVVPSFARSTRGPVALR